MIKSNRIVNFLYIQLLNYCINKSDCSCCDYKEYSDPCILFCGIFEELEFHGAVAEFESIYQAKLAHKYIECEKCPFNGGINRCGMISFSETMFFNGICNKDKKNDN